MDVFWEYLGGRRVNPKPPGMSVFLLTWECLRIQQQELRRVRILSDKEKGKEDGL